MNGAMRDLVWILSTIAAVLLALVVFLPVLGIVFLLVGAVLVVALAAPLLSKIPFFRRWIRVERYGNVRTVRFGRRTSWSYGGPGVRPDDDDVIDVEGREVPEEEPKRLDPPEP